jgi:hypothetical protein
MIVNLNTYFNTDEYTTGETIQRKQLPIISQSCGKSVGFLNVDESCNVPYCIPYSDNDTLYYQIYTGFNLTYIGWKITATNTDTGAIIWTSELKTTGISGVTVAPTGQNMWFRRTAIQGQNVDFFQIPVSAFSNQPFSLKFEYFNCGLLGLDPCVKISEYETPGYCYTFCDNLLIESTYDTEDCQGAIYGDVLPYIWTPLAGTAVEPVYRNVHRVKGAIEKTGLGFEDRVYTKTGKLTSFTSRDTFTIRTAIPQLAVDAMFTVLSGKDIEIYGT